MHKALQQRLNIDPRKRNEGARRLASIEDFVDATNQGNEELKKKTECKITSITAACNS